MQQLTPLDAWFIEETEAQFQHICDILIFEPEGRSLTLDELHRLLEERIHLVPPMRRRLVEVPFGMDEPYWIEDPRFDIRQHLFEHTLSEPGTDEQLAEMVASIAGVRLSRSRPLWELHLIHGIEGGRSALVKKFHHIAIDGGSGLEVTAILLDPTPEPRTVEPPSKPWVPDEEPEAEDLMVRGFTGMATRPMRMFDAQRKILERLPKPGTAITTPTGDGKKDGGILSAPMRRTKPMPWNDTITSDRAIAFGATTLTEIKAIKNAFGVTVNDVVVALCAGALRGWLAEQNALPNEPLIVCIPISVRTEDEQGKFGNRVSILVAEFPTHLADPVERLQAAHEAMKIAKDEHNAIGANILGDIGEFYMPALQARASRATAALQLPEDDLRWNISISNLPGSRVPLYLAGHKLQAHYPIGMVQKRQGMMFTVASYLDTLGIGIVADPNLVPDTWHILDLLKEETDNLSALAADKA